jgi:hypothetical protein
MRYAEVTYVTRVVAMVGRGRDLPVEGGEV